MSQIHFAMRKASCFTLPSDMNTFANVTDTVITAATIKEKEKSNDNVKPSSLAFNLDYLGPATRMVTGCKFFTKRRGKPACLLKRKEKRS